MPKQVLQTPTEAKQRWLPQLSGGVISARYLPFYYLPKERDLDKMSTDFLLFQVSRRHLTRSNALGPLFNG
jgi:hypothetical protein